MGVGQEALAKSLDLLPGGGEGCDHRPYLNSPLAPLDDLQVEGVADFDHSRQPFHFIGHPLEES